MLMGKPLAGAADTTLHFIQHQQPAMLVANFPQLLQIMNIWYANTTFPLNGFDQYRHYIMIMFSDLMDRVQIIVGNPNKTFN